MSDPLLLIHRLSGAQDMNLYNLQIKFQSSWEKLWLGVWRIGKSYQLEKRILLYSNGKIPYVGYVSWIFTLENRNIFLFRKKHTAGVQLLSKIPAFFFRDKKADFLV